MINIFCIIAKTGARRKRFLKDILSDKKFTEKANLKRLIYGSTKLMREDQIEDKDYHYVTLSEYNQIDNNDMIEFRSYYTIDQGVIYYYTLKKDFDVDNNLICVASPYQYEQYRSYCARENIKVDYEKYKVYAIIIDCKLSFRLRNIVKDNLNINDENTLYDICRKIISEKNEFEDVFARIPELHHPYVSDNACFVDNNDYVDRDYYLKNVDDIKHFILKCIKKSKGGSK